MDGSADVLFFFPSCVMIGNILCSFEQMGIFDEMARVSKPTYDATYYSAELKKTAHICVQDEM